MLVICQVIYLLFNVLCRDPQGQLRSDRFLNKTILCKPVGNFVSIHPSMSRNPIQCLCVLGRGIIQHLLALSYQRRCCVGSLNSFQSHLTIRANTNIFLWSNIHLNFINTDKDSIYFSIKNYRMFFREILSLLPKDFP